MTMEVWSPDASSEVCSLIQYASFRGIFIFLMALHQCDVWPASLRIAWICIAVDAFG